MVRPKSAITVPLPERESAAIVTVPAPPSITKVLEAPSESIVQSKALNSVVKSTATSSITSNVVEAAVASTASQITPFAAVEEAVSTKPFVPTPNATQSELVATIMFPPVALNAAKVSRFASNAWVSAPMVRPKLLIAVLVACKSERLLATCANAESAADML